MDINNYTFNELEISWALIKRAIPVHLSKSRLKRKYFLEICKEMNSSGTINGFERLLYNHGLDNPPIAKNNQIQIRKNRISADFTDKVHKLLPAQPWKPGTHKIIAKQLSCSESDIYKAVNILVESGLRLRQKDGIIYNLKGDIIEIDMERVDKETLKLKE
jgi:biotin operon repressor